MSTQVQPETSVLSAKFRLTSWPERADNEGVRSKKAPKTRRKKQMADNETENAGRGREAKYELDIDAQGVSIAVVTLEKDQKAEDGKVVKTHKQDSKTIKVSDLNGALGIFKNDEEKLFEFLSENLTTYYQRGDRARLFALAQGPQKNMERAIKALVAGGIDEASAKELVESKFKAEGLL